MAMGLKYYPPSVKEVPRGLTAPRPLYLFFALVVLVSLFAYLALYLGMIAGVGWFTYYIALQSDLPMNRYGIILRFGLTAVSGMLFIFLVKGLFKRHVNDLDHYTEIMEAGQPELFAFIRRLCREVGAPFPHRIFIAPDVNAAVFYDTSLLNLIVPVRKNLIIGLGLVQALNVNEFKAVLAHEFGHFSQSTTLLGQYVSIANRVVIDMVTGEDAWDDMLESWREVEWAYVSIFGYLLSAIVWVLKQALLLLFGLINIFHFALSRQMEYQADLVAVSIAGSDAIVNALIRIRAAAAAYDQAQQDLHPLALRGIFTRDFYYHQGQAEAFLRRQSGDKEWGRRPKTPAEGEGPTYHCSPAGERTSPFSSHPTLYEREQNAKRRYLPSQSDDTPAWLLIRDPEETRAYASLEAYEEMGIVVNDPTQRDPAEVQREIRPEIDESAGDDRYGGLYGNRLLQLKDADLEAIVAEIRTRPWQPARLQQFCRRLYAGEVSERMEAYHRHRREARELAALTSDPSAVKAKTFAFRGQPRPVQDAPALLRAVEHELDQDRQWLTDLDKHALLAHCQMGEAVQRGSGAALLARYRFHLAAQSVFQAVLERQQHLTLIRLAQRMPPGDSPELAAALTQAWANLGTAVAEIHQMARTTALPPFPEIAAVTGFPEGVALADWLSLDAHPAALVPGRIPDRWIADRLLREVDLVTDKLPVLLKASLQAIVRHQEQIAQAYQARSVGR